MVVSVAIGESIQLRSEQSSLPVAEKREVRVKTSTARHVADGTDERPMITITEKGISVTLEQYGNAIVQGTRLKGTGGDYTFTRSGTYTVQPGTYLHFVFGTTGVVAGHPPGEIISKIGYR